MVLELGCGDGFQLYLLRERFARVFPIDPKHAPADSAGFSFTVAEDLPFGDSTFDLIVSNCVLEHLKDRPRGIKEAVRVLRLGGALELPPSAKKRKLRKTQPTLLDLNP
ncbi:MAG TPA: class I SAM-dependent methyltransferase [Terriglobia bacterium]|nr:class I SAM-dependent methyltransferase [Terriglobia bacterium]